MVKAYYNYEQTQTFGSVLPSVVPVPRVVTANKRSYIMCASNEQLHLVCMKSRQVVQTVDAPAKDKLASVTAFHYFEQRRQVYIGYSNGDIVTFDLASNQGVAEFSSKDRAIIGLTVIEGNLSEFLVATCQDNSVMVYDLQMGELVYTLKDQAAPVVQVLAFAEAAKMVTVSKDGVVRIYNFANCVLEHSMPTGKADLSDARVIALDTDSASGPTEVLLMACSDDELLTLDLTVPHPQKAIKVFKRPSFHKAVQLEVFGTIVALLTDNNYLELYSTFDRKEVAKKYKRKVKRNVKDISTPEAYESDLRNYFGLECEVKLPDLSKRVALQDYRPADNKLALVAFTGKNQYRVVDVDLNEKKVAQEVTYGEFGHGHPILFSALSSDDFYFVSGSVDCVCLWELQNCKLVRRFALENATMAAFLPSDRFLVIALATGSLSLIDMNTHEVVNTYTLEEGDGHGRQLGRPPAAIADLAINHSFKTNKLELFAITANASVYGFQIAAKGTSVYFKQTFWQRLDEEPTRIRFSHDGRLAFVSFLNNSIKIYYADTFKEFLTMYGHALPVSDFDISTDDYVLASISLDKTIRVWDKDFGNCRRIINKVHENGGLRLKIVSGTHYAISTGKDGLVKMWDLDSFELVQVFESLMGADVRVLSLAREGQFFLAGGSGRVLRRFDQTKEQIFTSEVQEKLQEEAFVHEELKQGDQTLAKESVLKRYATVKSAEDIMDFIDDIERTYGDRQREYELDVVALGKRDRPTASDPEANGLNPAELVLERLNKIPKPELGAILDYVHYRHLEQLLYYVNYCVENELYPNLCFVLLQTIIEKQETNLLQNKAAMRVLSRTVDRMVAGFKAGLKTSTFNLAALNISLQEARMIKFK